MRVICISDTHKHHKKLTSVLESYVDDNDFNLLIHAGDVSSVGGKTEVTDFINWFMNLKGFDEKIFISGNHDFCFEQMNIPHHNDDYEWLKNLIYQENLSQDNCTYLEDNSIEIDVPNISRPITIYGTPWQPAFKDWAFNLPRNGEELGKKWNQIPKNTDILVTHTPPYGIGDYTRSNLRVGCELLTERFDHIEPILHVYGHIHEGYGIQARNKTIHVNASTCNVRYEPINEPHIVEIKEYYGEIIASHLHAE